MRHRVPRYVGLYNPDGQRFQAGIGRLVPLTEVIAINDGG
jgi:hypothetical protein